ncbi:MAG: hypothetical protein Q9227_004879 [Pyrenula ochraceoflavens]
MVATIYTALLGGLASIIAAQTVDIFLPEYGRYQDTLVAQSNAGVTTYLVGCGPQTVTTESCLAHPTGVGRDNSPQLCTGGQPYNTYTVDSCVLTAGATLLEGPSTIVFIAGGSDGFSVECSAAGTISAVCTHTFTDLQSKNVMIDTLTGSDYSFYHVPLTTGLTANGALPTLQPGKEANTTSAAPSTSSAASPSASSPITSTPTSSAGNSSSGGSQSDNNSLGSSSGTVTGSGSFTFGSGVPSNTTIPAFNGSSSATVTSPVATVTDSGAASLSQWIMGVGVAVVVAVVATM